MESNSLITLKKRPSRLTSMSQLLIGPTALGDAVLSTGLVAHMLEDRPDLPLTIACGAPAALILNSIPGLAGLHIMHKRPYGRHWFSLWNSIRGQRWTRIVDLRRSGIAWTIRAQTRHVVPHSYKGEHRVALTARTLGQPTLPPRVWLTEDHLDRAARLLPGDIPTLALGIGASWFGKTWPAKHFVELTNALTGSDGLICGARILLVGSSEERTSAKAIFNSLSPKLVVDGFGLDIPTTAAMLKLSTIFVGNDSAMMHLASAAGTRTVGLFGPTRDDLYSPWGSNSLVVRTPESVDTLRARIKERSSQESLMEGLTAKTVSKAIAKRWPTLNELET